VSTPPYPFNDTLGIGTIIGPAMGSNYFALHDHQYISPYVPDPTRAVVKYTFDSPTIVKGLEIIQHVNGVTQVEGFSGNSFGSLASLGSVFGPQGDAKAVWISDPPMWEYPFYNGQSYTFDFGNTTIAGSKFEFIVRKTSADGGYAIFNAYPLDVNGNCILGAVAAVPEPDEYMMMLMGAALVGFQVKRKKKLAETQN
jgi:hypothetical protein